MITLRILAVSGVLLAAGSPALLAQGNGAGVTTKAGVYNREQALRGQDVYAGNCRSCHTPESHTAAQFHARWSGKPLLELYAYIRDQMPKNDPGTLAAQEYTDVVAYILRLNRLPDGDAELPSDTATMRRIRIETGRKP